MLPAGKHVVRVHKQEPQDDAMKETYTAVVKQSGPWWIGWIEEIPGVNCQERSKEALLETLKVTLQEALEFNAPAFGSR